MDTMKNRVQLIGHVGNDPEVKILEGRKVANFNIATNFYYANKNGEKVEQTDWHRLVAWNENADKIEKLVTKGKEIAIEGKLSSRSYDDKDGNKRYITEVVVSDLMLIGKAN